MKKIGFFLLIITGLMLSSCVSRKQYNELLASERRHHSEAQNARRALAEAQANLRDLTAENERLRARLDQISQDTLDASHRIYMLNQDIDRLTRLNNELREQLGNSKSEEEVRLLLADIQLIQDRLLAKEDELNRTENQLSQLQATLSAKERELNAKERALEEQERVLAELQRTLEDQQRTLTEQETALYEKNQQVIELTEMLTARERLMTELRERISRALVGFEGESLTVTQRDGRIYVSLDEQLLFASGRWDVNPRGVTAIERLSVVLAENPDINVIVEGHTDNVPFRGRGEVLDNWDLSVKRATAVLRIILRNPDVDPVRITAAGRGEFVPVDPANTAEARQRNRRTEIILSPNLDEIMEMLRNY